MVRPDTRSSMTYADLIPQYYKRTQSLTRFTMENGSLRLTIHVFGFSELPSILNRE
jgi:hypothetical protein